MQHQRLVLPTALTSLKIWARRETCHSIAGPPSSLTVLDLSHRGSTDAAMTLMCNPSVTLPHVTEIVFRGPPAPLESLLTQSSLTWLWCAPTSNVSIEAGWRSRGPSRWWRCAPRAPSCKCCACVRRHRQEMQAAAVRLPLVRLAVRYDLA